MVRKETPTLLTQMAVANEAKRPTRLVMNQARSGARLRKPTKANPQNGMTARAVMISARPAEARRWLFTTRAPIT